jgi:DNA-binding transcriptional MerR regulator
LLLQREVAELFRCSPRTIRNWTGRGLLHPIHIGRRTFYSREEIERLSKIGATN